MTLRLDDVSYLVGTQTHIYPISLTLEKGTMNVLLGPTSSGKTSLMRLMAGLDVPTKGRIFWNDQDVTGQRVQDRQIAMVYQQFINYPAMSVYDNIASPMRLLGLDKSEIDRRVRETAALMQLTPMLARKPLELSGGQQQRCALARALVKNAGLVLLDEPLANLDYKLREELRAEIPRIFEESGSIFVYATTEPEEALLLGGNCATLWEGRVTQFGPTAQVYRQPADAITARVFSDPPMNFLTLEKRNGQMFYGANELIASVGKTVPDGRYQLGFRPNHLSLEPDSSKIRFETVLNVTEVTGSETFIHLAYDDARWVGLIPGVRKLKPGQALPVFVDPSRAYLFAEGGTLVAAAPNAEIA